MVIWFKPWIPFTEGKKITCTYWNAHIFLSLYYCEKFKVEYVILLNLAWFLLFRLSATNPPPTPPNRYPEEPQRNAVHSASNNERQSGAGLSPILSAARGFKPSLLLDPNYRRDLISRLSAASSSLLSPQGKPSSVPAQPNSGLIPPIHFEHMPTVENQHNPAGYNVSNMDSHVVEDEILQSVIRNSMLDIEVGVYWITTNKKKKLLWAYVFPYNAGHTWRWTFGETISPRRRWFGTCSRVFLGGQ